MHSTEFNGWLSQPGWGLIGFKTYLRSSEGGLSAGCANSGVGFATAKAIASASPDYLVIIGSRVLENGQAVVEEIQSLETTKGTLTSIQVDVTDRESIASAAKQVDSQFGRVDVLINNAGVLSKSPSTKLAMEETFAVNCIGPALVAEIFNPLLLKSDRPYSIFISSALGSLTEAADPTSPHSSYDGVPYRMSKAALNMLAVQQHKQFGPKGIKVFTLCPGLVRSNLRGKDENAISSGGRAGDPMVSAQMILGVMQGQRDGDVGKFLQEDSVCDW
ncbi:putative short chain dehydrogenase/reductase [Aspergillus clavatus NRRL 1]|uniref:Short chain dehydrogenase/reductase, putative n=1 Tax=Aspergillus clavatus (strain ATCC 1007 / CBS 513.65 / DSM 816 / NCTC 3887 / NRRL 1 / QM 1276 / 107) TaxID=344612 RepID=A1CBV3_ASPCL|nr:short chain dehydrogenase/reductase, putative [Aspergillus clavatus NRRL 1]EAW13221.1 short chain dehydrogenase/reductase, putative [Aspergillus clavatus NRRL 1]